MATIAHDGLVIQPQAGHEWMELRFDQPTDVSHVRLWLRRADFNDYPRQLLIETTEDGEHWEELYQGRGFPRLLLSLVERVGLDYAYCRGAPSEQTSRRHSVCGKLVATEFFIGPFTNYTFGSDNGGPMRPKAICAAVF